MGFNFKLTNLQSAIGLAQMDQFEARLEHQRQLYRWYRRHLPVSDRMSLLDFDVDGGECPQWIDIRVNDRDGLHDFLLENGISTRKYWFPLHTQTPYRVSDRDFPISSRASSESLWLPSSLTMTESDVQRVCSAIESWAKTE
ncbi:MAG: DegT/DnrJ/EryC1/StrS family aminotransferase [Anaerolineales bacterium]